MNSIFERMVDFFASKRAGLPEDVQTILSAAIVR